MNSTKKNIGYIRFQKRVGKILFAIILAIMIITLFGMLQSMKNLYIDTLNTLNSQQQEINDLSNKITNMELLYQTDNKNQSRGDYDRTNISQSDREYIERVCMAESNTIDGMMAVAQCISDRMHLWNKTAFEIVTQKDQFTEPAKGEISAEAVQAVWAVFDEGMKAFENNNVTHFYAEDSKEPYWTDGKEYVGNIGGNKFYY